MQLVHTETVAGNDATRAAQHRQLIRSTVQLDESDWRAVPLLLVRQPIFCLTVRCTVSCGEPVLILRDSIACSSSAKISFGAPEVRVRAFGTAPLFIHGRCSGSSSPGSAATSADNAAAAPGGLSVSISAMRIRVLSSKVSCRSRMRAKSASRPIRAAHLMAAMAIPIAITAANPPTVAIQNPAQSQPSRPTVMGPTTCTGTRLTTCTGTGRTTYEVLGTPSRLPETTRKRMSAKAKAQNRCKRADASASTNRQPEAY